jgi:hypothetical protein
MKTPPAIDNTEDLQDRPGLHALIVGLSEYPHLERATKENQNDKTAPHYGLRKLSSPALSAYRLARALLLWGPTLAMPIATIRLLLSPSEDENISELPLVKRAVEPTWDNFAAEAQNWRQCAASHKDNIAFFYFGGHGLQRDLYDQILLLKGFGDGLGAPLNHGVDTQRLLRGMAGSDLNPNMARRQIFLFDACRTPVPDISETELESVRDIWKIDKTDHDDRNCAVFYATMPGRSSYANRGKQTVFVRAFINALNGIGAEETQRFVPGGGKATWAITASSLAASLSHLIRHDPTPISSDQQLFPAGARPDFIIREMYRAPRVKFQIRLNPSKDHERASFSLRDGGNLVCHTGKPPIRPYPFESVLYAGNYIGQVELSSTRDQAYTKIEWAIPVLPLRNSILLKTS